MFKNEKNHFYNFYSSINGQKIAHCYSNPISHVMHNGVEFIILNNELKIHFDKTTMYIYFVACNYS